MVTKYTWPNFRGSDYDGVKVIILSYLILRYKLVTKYMWPNFCGSDYDGVKVIILSILYLGTNWSLNTRGPTSMVVTMME